MTLTPDELDLLKSRVSHDIERLKRMPQESEKFNQFVSSAIQRREKILFKLEHKLKRVDICRQLTNSDES